MMLYGSRVVNAGQLSTKKQRINIVRMRMRKQISWLLTHQKKKLRMNVFK